MTSVPATFDFKSTVSEKRLRGLWRMMRGYRLIYVGALLFIGLGAVINTLTYVLLAYFIDDVLGQGIYTPTVLLVIALGFVGHGAAARRSSRFGAGGSRHKPRKASRSACAIISTITSSASRSAITTRRRPAN